MYKNVVFGGLRLHGVVVSEKKLVESGKHGCRRHYSRFCVGRCRNERLRKKKEKKKGSSTSTLHVVQVASS